jgi:putative zinc finger/helix-turn-helix YgiT family protein
MATTIDHQCGRKTRKEFLATPDKPFRFSDSGLSDVYLVGIRYFVCDCGKIVADIPAMRQLLSLIARDLVEKPKALAPEEIRFLRKRLGKKQADLAKEIGVRPETLSRFETGETRANERTDKLIRLHYALSSNDPILIDHLQPAIQELLASWEYTEVPAHIVATVTDNEWEAVAA